MTVASDLVRSHREGTYVPPTPSRRGRGIVLPGQGRRSVPEGGAGSVAASLAAQVRRGKDAEGDLKDFDYAAKALHSETELNRALKKIVDNPDIPDKVKNQAKSIADRVGNRGTSASVLGKITNVIQKPLNVVMATLDELDELQRGNDTGNDDFLENLGGINAPGLTGQEFLKDAGMGGGWQRRALGFGLDVALDPLTYLAPETALDKLGTKGLARALEEVGMTAKATEVLADGRSVMRAKDFAELASKGGPELTGGLKFRVPGTGSIGRKLLGGSEPLEIGLAGVNTTRQFGRVSRPLRKAINAGKELPLLNKLQGRFPELDKLMRSGDPDVAPVALKVSDAIHAGDDIGKKMGDKWLAELVPTLRQFKNHKDDLRNFLEGDLKASLKLKAAGLEESAGKMRQWFDAVREQAIAAGVPIEQFEDYFTHLRTQAAKEKWGTAAARKAYQSDAKKIVPEYMRNLKQGSVLFGETLKTGSIDEIASVIRAHVPESEFIDLFEKDPFKVMPAYARMMSGRVAQEHTRQLLRDGKLIVPLDSPGANKALKALKSELGKQGLVDEAAVEASERAEMGTAILGSEKLNAARKGIDDAERTLGDLADTHGVASTLPKGKDARRVATVVDREFETARQTVDSAREAHKLVAQNAQELINETTRMREEVLSLRGNRGGSSATWQQARQAVEDAEQWAAYAAEKGQSQTTKLTASLHVQAAKSELEMLRQGKKVASAEEVLAWARKSKGQPNGFLDLAEQELLDGYQPFLLNEQAHDIAAETLGEMTKIQQRGGMAAFLPFYDKALTLWKQLAILTPGFHFRNAMGILWNNWVAEADLLSLKRYVSQARVARSGGEANEVYRLIEDSGLLDELGQIGFEAATGTKVRTGAARVANIPFELSRQTGASIEHVGRGWLAYDTVEKALARGASKEVAMQSARDAVYKFHFNYNDLSDFERNVVRRIVPFYTWTRKNLPLQLEMMARNPGKYSRYVSAKRALTHNQEEGVVPGYYGQMESFRLPGFADNEEGGTYLAPDLPFTRLADFDPLMNEDNHFDPLNSRLKDTLIGQANPIIKLPFELWAGKRFFNDLPLNTERTTDIANEVNRPFGNLPGMQWVRVPGVLPVLEFLGRASRDKEGNYIVGEDTAYILEQVFPPFNRARRLFPNEERFQSRLLGTWLSTALGVGVRFNTNQEQNAELRRRLGTVQQIIGDLKEQGYDTESDEFKQQITPLSLLAGTFTKESPYPTSKRKKRTRKAAPIKAATAAPLVRALEKLGQSRR